MKLRRLVSLAFFIALSVALHYAEGFIPFLSIPGFRIGLSNIATLFVLYYYGGISYIFVMVAKVLLVALISTGFGPAFFMSAFGAALTILGSAVVYYWVRGSIYSVSVLGSVLNAIGQLAAYAIFFETPYIFIYLSVLGPLAMVTGIILAILVALIVKRLPKSFRSEEKKRRV
jgi:heptaprenyl diphosphate synthase